MIDKNAALSAPDEDALLLGYLEGTLTSIDEAHVRELLHRSPDAASRLSLLEAAELPYSEAFARQNLPPVPASLTRKIDALVRHYDLTGEAVVPDAALAGSRYVHEPYVENRARPETTRDASASMARSAAAPTSRRFSLPWLTGAFAAGALCCGLVLSMSSALTHGSGLSPWVQAVTSYQALYTRDTVASLPYDATMVDATVQHIRQEDGIDLKGVPDLRSAGLTFKRVQRLNFNGKPLVQLVYLPANGAPVALCVIADAKPDELVAMQQDKSLDVVTWRRDKLAYALVGHVAGLDLTELGKHLAENGISALPAGWQPS